MRGIEFAASAREFRLHVSLFTPPVIKTISNLSIIMSTNLFKVKQILRGRVPQYTITNKIHRDTVWFARYELTVACLLKSISTDQVAEWRNNLS